MDDEALLSLQISTSAVPMPPTTACRSAPTPLGTTHVGVALDSD